MKGIVFVLLSVSLVSIADARIFGRRRVSTKTYSSSVSVTTGSDQQRAQAKANVMASRRVMSHNVAPLVGNFEGIGVGSSRNCSTCTPNRGMRLTADAAAYANGRWYRVRAWR